MVFEIETINLTKKYAKKTVLDKISIRIKKGTILGLVGPNGAGKTTLIRLLIGTLKPNSGNVLIKGHDLQKNGYYCRKNIGYIPEGSWGLPSNMRGTKFSVYMGQLKGLSKTEAKKETHQLLKIMDFKESADKKIGNMSSGMKQKISIAQALLGNPDIIIADEPSSNLDPITKRTVFDIFSNLSKNEEKTFLISSHILTELEGIISEVSIINKGILVYSGKVEDLKLDDTSLFRLKVDKPEEILKYINNMKNIDVEAMNESGIILIKTRKPEHLYKELPDILASHNASLMEFNPENNSLEDKFLRILRKANNNKIR